MNEAQAFDPEFSQQTLYLTYFSLFFSMRVCVCICTCMFLCVFRSTCVCMLWSLDHKLRCGAILSNAIYLPWNIVCYLTGAHQVRLDCPASNPRKIADSHFPILGSQAYRTTPGSYIWVCGSNSYLLHAFKEVPYQLSHSLFDYVLWWILKIRGIQSGYLFATSVVSA